VREQHMLDTIQGIMGQARETPKIIVWAHNLHVGDARANEIGNRGNMSLGQMIRQRYPEQSVAVAFSTYSGEVVASDGWGQEPKKKTVLPARKGSYEDLFHQLCVPRFLLIIRGSAAVERMLNETEREQRNIGVVYTPEDEDGHYYKTRLADQFDAIVHFDKTSALEIF
jgi:erythromycin esterase-like protein